MRTTVRKNGLVEVATVNRWTSIAGLASDEQIQEALSTVLCRCFTHVRMLRAIKRYAQEVAG